jgi:UDP-glucose 4-epimerase
VGQVIVRSHSAVYGASPLNPTLISEARSLARDGLSGLLRDYAEVEQFVAEFAPSHPAMRLATLRCAPLAGCWSPLIDYLRQPAPQTLLGFDPALQLLHVDDAVEAFALAATRPCAGAYNLAADDPVGLAQAIRLAGQQPRPTLEPLLARADSPGSPALPWPLGRAFLRYGCLADTARARRELGWAPAHRTAAMLRAARSPDAPPNQADSEAALRAFLSRRR